MNHTALLISTTNFARPSSAERRRKTTSNTADATADAINPLLKIDEPQAIETACTPPAPRKRTKRDIAMLAIGAALAVGAAYAGATILGLTEAHADSPFIGTLGDHSAFNFHADSGSVGVGGTLSAAGDLAQLLCSNMENHRETEAQAIAAGMKAADLELPGATYVVHSAEFHFCPDLYVPEPAPAPAHTAPLFDPSKPVTI